MVRTFRRLTLYPFLFGAYPVLVLLAHNIAQVKPTVAWRALVITIMTTVILLLGLRLFLRDWHRAAILCTLILILFFSYGHVYEYLKQMHSFGSNLARHRYLLPLWIGIFGIGVWWTIRRLRKPQSVTSLLNIVATIAIVFPIVQITSFEIKSLKALADAPDSNAETQKLRFSGDQPPPDIYYIILDAYTRDDILLEVYQYDNTPFLNSLTEMGFYVARCSQSNYTQTELSMASSFNMDYLEALGDDFVKGSSDRSGLWPLLRHGKVRQIFEGLGYKVIAFQTGFYWIQWADADLYLSPVRKGSLNEFFSLGGLNGFEAMILSHSAAMIVIDAANVPDLLKSLIPDMNYPNNWSRERTLYIFDQLRFDKIPSIQGPKFLYIHIIAPHPPYVFGPNGEFPDENDSYGYRDQIIYVNKRIGQVVDEIISKSKIPPIIILQGDHGLRHYPSERMAILNAYYLPEGGDHLLYPSISPVNTFRLIFDYYFGGNYGLLEDISYFSSYEMPYDYEVAPIAREGCDSGGDH